MRDRTQQHVDIERDLARRRLEQELQRKTIIACKGTAGGQPGAQEGELLAGEGGQRPQGEEGGAPPARLDVCTAPAKAGSKIDQGFGALDGAIGRGRLSRHWIVLCCDRIKLKAKAL
ncbi:MAG: hypothetical protein KDE01_11740 [Caldilineaceae bacterium]|nr:hypothetical protein [Caldilineaceae bacterium]